MGSFLSIIPLGIHCRVPGGISLEIPVVKCLQEISDIIPGGTSNNPRKFLDKLREESLDKFLE